MASKTLSLVTDRFDRARNYRVTSQDDVWKRSYKNWRGELDSSQFPWRSKLFIPWSFTVVETIIPKIFARDPKWRALAASPDFPEDGPSVIQDLLDYQWNRMGMRLKMYDYIKDSLMYSKGFAKVGWKFKPKTTTVMEPIVGKDDKITYEKKTKSSIEYDDPIIDIVDPSDLYIDPDATSAGYCGDAKYIIHRKTVPLAEVKDNPNYRNVDQIKDTNGNDIYEDKLFRYRDTVPQKDKQSENVEILEYWEKDRLIVVANRSVILRDTPNPYSHKEIPFVELDDYRDPHRLYGQSELSVIDPLQREINSIRNQRRDYDNLALNPVIRMIPGTLRNPNSAVMAPGSVWMVSDLNSMDIFELPQLQGSAVQVEQQTAQDVQRAVAVDEIGIGLMPENAQRVAATTIVSSQSNAGKRFAIKIALLEEAVKKIGQLVFALNQQFLDKERLIQIVGEQGATEWVEFTPEDIRGNYKIDIETGSMLPKDEVAARQEAIQLLQYITPLVGPVLQSNPSVMMPILKMILNTFELPEKSDILEELGNALGLAEEQMQQQQLAQQAATEAQAIGATQQAVAATEQANAAAAQAAPPVPETAQGTRADQELANLINAS